ncbi:MAG: TonB-dependent receptor [Bacteroidetes bacterium]|nr:TonB-dependent receptor [Bacteroidota bacterium]
MRITALFFLFLSPLFLFPQDTLLIGSTLPEVVFEEDKKESDRLFTPQRIESIGAEELKTSTPSSTADVLQKNGAAMVQMSQSGGGSPIIRGFEANRVLLVIDGVRLNNAIFRSGHLQNIISTSPEMLQKMDVVFGPASVKYGSDALGGVIHLHTKSPEVGQNTILNFTQKISSANRGVGSHFDASWSNGKWAFLQGLSVHHYGNSLMGENRLHAYADWGREEHITQGKEQLNTAFQQADFIQKFRFDANNHLSFLINTQYSTTTNISRFDKLNDIKDGQAKYAKWYYGPQKSFLTALSTHYNRKTALFDELNNNIAFQRLHESRHSQKLEGTLFKRNEQVTVLSSVTDFNKSFGHSTLNYGFDFQHNQVNSSANEGVATRYADGGSQMSTLSAYGQYKHPFAKRSFLSAGLRYSKTLLNATFNDTSSYSLPFSFIHLNNDAFTGSFGLFVGFGNGWEGSTSLSSGFRSPNVDDVTKVFSKSGTVTVPNDQLKPEYSYNAEITISKKWMRNGFVSATYFYTLLKGAIIKKDFILNGQSTLLYDGELLPIVASQNTQEAFLFGYHLKISAPLGKHWSSTHSVSYTFGKDKTNNSPLDHIPPLYGKSDLKWAKGSHSTQAYVLYNGWKHIAEYSRGGSDNPEEATEDGTPSWWTLNFSYSKQINQLLRAQISVENLLDVHYKTYSSGISAPGRNFILSLGATF